MAIIWHHEILEKIPSGKNSEKKSQQFKKKRYEVRKAGNSLRLYTNGVFHSQYNPNYPIGGTIWDLLVLPALYTAQDIKRVLVLGVGGGAVIQQLKALTLCEEIVGVELDPIHIKIAKKYFGVNKVTAGSKSRCRVTLHCADAIQWLKDYKGKPFDMIIDDLFFENDGDPQRAIPANKQWCQTIARNLKNGGTIVINFDTHSAVKSCALATEKSLSKSIVNRHMLFTSGYDNRVAAFYQTPIDCSVFKERIDTLNKEYHGSIKRRYNAMIRKF